MSEVSVNPFNDPILRSFPPFNASNYKRALTAQKWLKKFADVMELLPEVSLKKKLVFLSLKCEDTVSSQFIDDWRDAHPNYATTPDADSDWEAFSTSFIKRFDTGSTRLAAESQALALIFNERGPTSINEHCQQFLGIISGTRFDAFRACQLLKDSFSQTSFFDRINNVWDNFSTNLEDDIPTLDAVQQLTNKILRLSHTINKPIRSENIMYRPKRSDFREERCHNSSEAEHRSRFDETGSTSTDVPMAFKIQCWTCGGRGHYTSDCKSGLPRNEWKNKQHPSKSINAVRGAYTFHANVKINNYVQTQGLVDTGAGCSLISEAFIKACGLDVQLLPTQYRLSSANNSRITELGEVKLVVTIDDSEQQIPVTCVVVPHCSANMILGAPFINEFVDYITGEGQVILKEAQSTPVVTNIQPFKILNNAPEKRSDNVNVTKEENKDSFSKNTLVVDEGKQQLEAVTIGSVVIPAESARLVTLAVNGLKTNKAAETLFTLKTNLGTLDPIEEKPVQVTKKRLVIVLENRGRFPVTLEKGVVAGIVKVSSAGIQEANVSSLFDSGKWQDSSGLSGLSGLTCYSINPCIKQL